MSKSWVWTYYKKLNNGSAVCKVNKCGKILKACRTTSTLASHLRSQHKIFNPTLKAEDWPSEPQSKKQHTRPEPEITSEATQLKNARKLDSQRSWVWNYFATISDSETVCLECKKHIKRTGGTTSGMRNHLRLIHCITEDEGNASFTQELEVKEVKAKPRKHTRTDFLYSIEKCFICNEVLGACRNKLSALTSFTSTPLNEILESFIDTEFSENTIEESAICQDCFLTIDKFDDLQHQSEQIQNKLQATYQKTHSPSCVMPSTEEIFIKQEMLDSDEERKPITTSRQRSKHIDGSEVSESFLLKTEEVGINYNYEAFQRAFFTPAERESSSAKAPKKRTKQVTRLEDSSDTSNDAPSDSDSGKKNLRSDNRIAAKRKGAEISPEFRKKIEESEVEYDLDKFQRAFGFSETNDSEEAEVKSPVESTNEFASRKTTSKFPCEPCGKAFSTDVSLQIHLATGHDRQDPPFDCPVCFKIFQDRGTLRIHYYTHVPRTFLCGRCGATYKHKKSFDLHMMCHDNIRPHPCTYDGCSKAFRNSSKLRIHKRVHTGEKIYECRYCPEKRFAQKYGLDLHIKKHHQNEVVSRVKCDLCSIWIPSKAKMVLHQTKFHKIVPDESSQ